MFAKFVRNAGKVFFDDLRALTKYLLFDSWQHLLTFMLCESAPLTPANTS